ncbi:regulator of G protein signaling domain protein [Cooperia oncophora]
MLCNDFYVVISPFHGIHNHNFQKRYFKDFENSLYHKKYQLQVFSRWCSLDDILYVPALLNAFLEFVDDRHDHDCLQFLLACNAFEKNYDSLPDEEALEDAMSIYDKYFSMQAISPIQIGDTARRRMESEICSDRWTTHCNPRFIPRSNTAF